MGVFFCRCDDAAAEEEGHQHSGVELKVGSEEERELLGVHIEENKSDSHPSKQEKVSESFHIRKAVLMEMKMEEKVPILIQNDFRRLFGVSYLIQYGHFIHYYMSDIIYQYSDFINYMKSGSILMRGLDKFCAIVISDDGRYLFASTDDGWVITWDLDYHEIMHKRKAHCSAIRTMAYRNGWLATGGVDCEIHIWDIYTMTRIPSLPRQREAVFQLDFNDSGDHLVCCTGHKRFQLYSLETGKRVRKFIGHGHTVMTAQYIGSDQILGASRDNVLILWNANTGELTQTFDAGILGQCHNLSINSDRSLVACNTGSYSMVLSYPWLMPVSQMNANVCFHPLIPNLVAGQNYNPLSICDARTGKILREFPGHSALVSALSFTPDGSRLVSASHDRTVKIWDIRDLA